jgi:urease accessory protein
MGTNPTATAMTGIITAMLERAASALDRSDLGVTPAALQRLLAWLSPSFPVGAYTYSHGLEWAIEDGTVGNAADLAAWLDGVLRHGSGRNDAILFAHAWRAAATDDAARLQAVAELAAAFQPSKERHLEATAQGRAFLQAVTAAWPNDRLAALAAGASADIAYPVAVAMAAAAYGVPLEPSLVAFLNGFVSNIVSAGVRAVPIGQTDGQRIIAGLGQACEAVAVLAPAAELGDLGGIALRADIASMKHETQYTRLFRS